MVARTMPVSPTRTAGITVRGRGKLREQAEPAQAQPGAHHEEQRAGQRDRDGEVHLLLPPAELAAEGGVDLAELPGLAGEEVLAGGGLSDALELLLVDPAHVLPAYEHRPAP